MSDPVSHSRTADRDFDIWQRYSDGQTQEEIAAHHRLTQQMISLIIARMRDDIPIEERRARQRRQLADLDHLRQTALNLADTEIPTEDHAGRIRAMDLVVKLQEREAKALGTDAATKISLEAEQTGERIKSLLRRITGESATDEPD